MSTKFRTQYSEDTKDFISEPGSKYLDQYSYDFDEKGEVKSSTLHVTDKPINVYEKIQADYASTDINLLMQRFALGDSSAINVREGVYADVTKMPKTWAELFDRVNTCEDYFVRLPAELKQMFNNSYEEFWSEYGSKDFEDKIDEYNDRFIDHSFDIDEPAEVIKEGAEGDE